MGRRRLLVPTIAISSMVLAIGLLVGLVISKSSTDRTIAKVVNDNASDSCARARTFWIVQRDVINEIARPISPPPAVLPDGTDNSYNRNRTQLRNDDFVARGKKLLDELGPMPALC